MWAQLRDLLFIVRRNHDHSRDRRAARQVPRGAEDIVMSGAVIAVTALAFVFVAMGALWLAERGTQNGDQPGDACSSITASAAGTLLAGEHLCRWYLRPAGGSVHGHIA